MNARFLGGLAAAALLVPLSANAVPITWNLSGSITTVSGVTPDDDDFPPFIYTGAPYSLSVTFDTARYNSNPANPCAFNDGGSGCISAFGTQQLDAFRISIGFGGNDCEDGIAGVQPCSPDYGFSPIRAGIFIYNDFLPSAAGAQRFDGVRFTLFPGTDEVPGTGQRWSFGLFGTPDLFSSMPSLASLETLDPSIFSLQVFDFCDDVGNPFSLCNQGAVNVIGTGPRESVPVPEPGTLALLGMALAGMGMARRRRAS